MEDSEAADDKAVPVPSTDVVERAERLEEGLAFLAAYRSIKDADARKSILALLRVLTEAGG